MRPIRWGILGCVAIYQLMLSETKIASLRELAQVQSNLIYQFATSYFFYQFMSLNRNELWQFVGTLSL
jgi:hypothetical protein